MKNLVLLLSCLLISCSLSQKTPLTDDYLMHRAVKLVKDRGGCSGEQIMAPSGQNYILTAAHCKVLEDNGYIKAITEDGKELMRRIIAEDPKSDLLLLEGLPGVEGIKIAAKDEKHQHLRTFTHGALWDTYKTEGSIIQDANVKVMVSIIQSEEEEAKCASLPKYKVEDLNFFGIAVAKACIMEVVETVTQAMIVPGSSGGMVVDDSGDLIGVVSAGGGGFGLLVTLNDIRAFLGSY